MNFQHRMATDKTNPPHVESIFCNLDTSLYSDGVTVGQAGDLRTLVTPKDIDGVSYSSHASYHEGCLPLRELIQVDAAGIHQVGAVLFHTAERYGLHVVGLIRRTPAQLDPRRGGNHAQALGKPGDFLMQLTVCKGNESGEQRFHYIGSEHLDKLALIHGHPFVKDIPHILSASCFIGPITKVESLWDFNLDLD